MTGLAAALAALGVEAVYGDPLEGVATIAAPSGLARLLADAHAAVRLRPAATSIDGRVQLGDDEIGIEPVPATEPWTTPAVDVVDAVRAAEAPLLLVGRGVLAARAIPGVHALAAALSAGVLNTVSAKGTFDWRSRHHWATVGLQRDDIPLAGTGEADLVVVTGLEAGDRRLLDDLACRWLEVAPTALDPLAEHVGRPWRPLAYPPLRSLLGTISQEGWEFTGAPLAPSRVTRNYAEVLGPHTLVAADAGTVGYWVGRTYTTTAPAGAVVADARRPGFALAASMASRLHDPLRPTLAVTGSDLTEIDVELLALAAARGVALPVERWGAEGEAIDAATHAERLRRLVATGGQAAVAPASEQLSRMEAVAGPVTAWEDEQP